jgi:predicted ester cyclase
VRHVVTHLIAEGDLVAAHVKMTGTHTSPFGAIAPTGKVLNPTGAYHCHIVDGRLVEDWDSWTVLPLFQQTIAVLQS